MTSEGSILLLCQAGAQFFLFALPERSDLILVCLYVILENDLRLKPQALAQEKREFFLYLFVELFDGKVAQRIDDQLLTVPDGAVRLDGFGERRILAVDDLDHVRQK